MERRALIALALSFVVFMGFMYYGEKTKGPTTPPAATQTATPAPAARPRAPAPAAVHPAPPVRPQPARPAKDVVVDTPSFKAVFTELGGRLKSFHLKKYKDRIPYTPFYHFKLGPVAFELDHYIDPAADGIKTKDLVREGDANELPLTLSWEGKTLNVSGLGLCEASTSALNLKAGEKGTLKFTCVSPEGLTMVKTFTFKGDSYGFDLAVQVTNRTGQAVNGQLNLDLSENFAGEEASRFHFLGFNGSINNKLEDIKSGGVKDAQDLYRQGGVGRVGRRLLHNRHHPRVRQVLDHSERAAESAHGGQRPDPGGRPGRGTGGPVFLRPVFRPEKPGRSQALRAGSGGQLRLVRLPGETAPEVPELAGTATLSTTAGPLLS